MRVQQHMQMAVWVNNHSHWSLEFAPRSSATRSAPSGSPNARGS